MSFQDYLDEIQDFDDTSQKSPLTELQNGNLLDFSSLMHQSNKSFQDFLSTTSGVAQPIQLGENVRGMSNVSPLLQVRPANNSKTASAVKKSYFIDAQIEQKGNLTVINDLKKTTKDRYLYTYLDVFFDKNLNGVRDPDEKLMFTVYFFFSDDGNKVREAYNASKLEESDIYFFIEGDEDFFSSKKLYAKISPLVKKQFYNKDGELDERFFNASIMGTLSKETGFEADIVKELLEKGNVEKDNVKLENVLTTLKQGLLYFFSTSKATGWVCNKIGNGLDYLKISDDFWDTQSEDYFFDKDNLLKKITISDDLVNEIDKLFVDKKGLDLHDITPNIFEEYIKKYSNAIKKFIRYYNNFVTEEIEAVYRLVDSELGDFLAGKMQIWVAFRCGLWNGLVDFISSLFKFVGEILEVPFNAVLDFQGAMETLDNIYDFLFGGQFWENLGNAATEMYRKMLDFCKAHHKEDYDWVRVSYMAGSGIAFIMSFFIPYTQVLKVAGLGKVAEIIGAVNKEVGAAISAVAKYGKDQAYKAVSALLELFSKGGKAFWDFLKKVWDELEKWFLSARYKLSKAAEFLGLGFSRETAETLGNLGLKPKLGFQSTAAPMNIPYGNFITRLEYKGFTVFKGSKKAVATFARELEEMGEEAAIKHLEDLLNKFNKFLPENCDILFKDGSYNFKDLLTDELVGLVEINGEGFLEFGIYRKGLSTQITGKQVFNALIEHLKIRKITFKGIRGLWSGASDNVTAFNNAIQQGMTAEKAAFETWTGKRALEQGYEKVIIQELTPPTPPHTKIYVEFYK
ncbi:hypothetical protein [Chryseobacterium sp. JM1]|uniref:hypothetical protein n=1 Tax=Chryseobacterium sp. JM1 TaxID=1233950 RepID=UPI0004E688A9|nr:hypothetical protein [Chryseobacterium sp. JM1]KFF21065.1 hypothetical protein IW22_12270 [Chryseobacterium sp. JM1]